MVVTSSVGATSLTWTEQGLKALPLMWLVHARHTSSPQPYFGPWMPSRSRRTQSSRTLSSHSTVTCSPLTTKLWVDIEASSEGVLQAVGGRLRQRGNGRDDVEAQGLVVVDREAGRDGPGGSGVGARDRRNRRRHAELARAAGHTRRGRKHEDLHVGGDVPLPGVVGVVPA